MYSIAVSFNVRNMFSFGINSFNNKDIIMFIDNRGGIKDFHYIMNYLTLDLIYIEQHRIDTEPYIDEQGEI